MALCFLERRIQMSLGEVFAYFLLFVMTVGFGFMAAVVTKK